jgi:hypothetical protein
VLGGVVTSIAQSATDVVAVALAQPEAMPGFVKAGRPTQGKEEATEVIAACYRSYGCRRPTDRPWYPPVPAYPHPLMLRAGMRVAAGILRGR